MYDAPLKPDFEGIGGEYLDYMRKYPDKLKITDAAGKDFIGWFFAVALKTRLNSAAHGFAERDANKIEKLALIMCEGAEAIEALRLKEMPQSAKIPDFTLLEEELADIVIRCMSMAVANGYRLSEAIIAKHNYNTTRPFMHGGKVA